MPLVFNPKYFFLAALLLAVEVCIALFLKDTIIRPFIGDVLVVILIYCFIRIFLNTDYRKIAVCVFIFACLIEIGQYFDYVSLLHLENYHAVSIIMGRTFEWSDFIAYFTGFLIIILLENQKLSSRL